ncbi:hypothetical protein KW493_07290 [Vibrio fluvialis]|nr:hypothetical protein [Vibrio fluvialis]MBY8128078.1 hypothetical protein [Vibrio fluvialis]
MGKLIYGAVLLVISASSLAGWFSSPEVESVTAVSSDSIQICFNEPFKSEGLIYALEFGTKAGQPFSYGGYYKFLLTKNSKDLCSYNIRLSDYFHRGNSTPEDLRKIMSRIELSSFEKITVKIATPKGQTALTKTQPDEMIFEKTYSFSR